MSYLEYVKERYCVSAFAGRCVFRDDCAEKTLISWCCFFLVTTIQCFLHCSNRAWICLSHCSKVRPWKATFHFSGAMWNFGGVVVCQWQPPLTQHQLHQHIKNPSHTWVMFKKTLPTTTVDGRTPLVVYQFIPLFTRCYTSQVVVTDFFHQQYEPFLDHQKINLTVASRFIPPLLNPSPLQIQAPTAPRPRLSRWFSFFKGGIMLVPWLRCG